MSTSLGQLEKQIDTLKKQLMALGPMRPGSITRQYRQPKEKQRPFYQISYTHRMRSRSEYVRPDNLVALRRETATFKRFKKLIERWVDLSLKASKLRVSQLDQPPRQ